MTTEPLRIANCSGFYGDRFSAAREMVEGGPIHVLTGDYLAELTMLILWKARQKDHSTGYAATFLRQLEEIVGTCLDRGIKIVTNAGGLNPGSLALRVRELVARLGIPAQVAHIEGDDVLAKIPELQERGEEFAHLDTGKALATSGIHPITANAYLGGFGIAAALQEGADIVVCPRVTDASLVVGPAAWHFGWSRTDYDALAGAVVAGHILECGPQATGGNYCFFEEIPSFAPGADPSLLNPGFPLAEVFPDGSCIISKHPGTGGLVSTGTVTAQLLYEIDQPRYANPDVVARFDTIQLESVGTDQVRVSGVRGEPPPDTLKVCINYLGGFRNSITLVLTGLAIEEKARLATETLFANIGGREQFDSVRVQLVRQDITNPPSNESASAYLRITVKDRDARKVGRAFTNAAIEMALANYPGFYATSPPTAETPYGVYWPTKIPAEAVDHTVVSNSGKRFIVPAPPKTAPLAQPSVASANDTNHDSVAGSVEEPAGTTPTPLGRIMGARSGDKGGNANVGVWVREDRAWAWLRSFLSVERFRELLPEAGNLEVRRFELPNLRAINFVVVGLLEEGVASSTRQDAQAKSLGEYLRARIVHVPDDLLRQ